MVSERVTSLLWVLLSKVGMFKMIDFIKGFYFTLIKSSNNCLSLILFNMIILVSSSFVLTEDFNFILIIVMTAFIYISFLHPKVCPGFSGSLKILISYLCNLMLELLMQYFLDLVLLRLQGHNPLVFGEVENT